MYFDFLRSFLYSIYLAIYCSGYQIPKGTFVMRVGVMMSTDDKYFDDPEDFIPERWVRGTSIYLTIYLYYICSYIAF